MIETRHSEFLPAGKVFQNLIVLVSDDYGNLSSRYFS